MFGPLSKHERIKNGKTISYYMAYQGRRQITASTKEALIEKLLLLISESQVQELSVDELAELYFADRAADCSLASQTSDYDRSNWNRFFLDSVLRTKKVKSVTSADILSEYKLLTGRGNLTKKVFSKASCLLNGMFDFAVEKEIITSNPARAVSQRKLVFRPEAVNTGKVYEPEERELLIKYLKSIPQTTFTLACRLMACFPLRMGELRALTWEDYDEKNHRLLICKEISKEHREGKKRCDVEVPFTKGAKETGIRWLPVSTEASKVLEELRRINGSKRYILHGERDAKFSVPANHINEHLRDYCKKAGVSYYSSHKFRFYGATQLYKKGVPLPTIQYYLGHSSLKMTMHYLRIKPEDAAIEVIESVFG